MNLEKGWKNRECLTCLHHRVCTGSDRVRLLGFTRAHRIQEASALHSTRMVFTGSRSNGLSLCLQLQLCSPTGLLVGLHNSPLLLSASRWNKKDIHSI